MVIYVKTETYIDSIPGKFSTAMLGEEEEGGGRTATGRKRFEQGKRSFKRQKLVSSIYILF